MKPITARGFRDVLPIEAAERESVNDRIRAVFSAWGYEPVETPAVEDYETLQCATRDLAGTAFKLFDMDGRLLALRPEMTVPIARLVAGRMDPVGVPLRLRYASEVFREQESLRGQARQFTQVGVELLGQSGPAADVEVIAMLAEALQASGLDDFTIAVGDARVLSAIVGAADDDEEWRVSVLAAMHDRNLVEVDRLSGSAPGRIGEALRSIVRTRGAAEAIDSCRELLEPLGILGELDDLEETLGLLGGMGLSDRVMVDFGVMRSFDYYTGVVFEVYAAGIGLPIGGGGRYDAVLGSYGADAPAIGFAIGLERLVIALAEGRKLPEPATISAVVGGKSEAAFAEAARRRGAGERVVLAAGIEGNELRERAAALGAEAVEAR